MLVCVNVINGVIIIKLLSLYPPRKREIETLNLNLLLQNVNGTFPDKDSYSKHYPLSPLQAFGTERGGSVVPRETRIREVPGSNPGIDQPDWGFFVVFLNHQGKYWIGFSLPRSI